MVLTNKNMVVATRAVAVAICKIRCLNNKKLLFFYSPVRGIKKATLVGGSPV
jgi:hypothetical protein